MSYDKLIIILTSSTVLAFLYWVIYVQFPKAGWTRERYFAYYAKSPLTEEEKEIGWTDYKEVTSAQNKAYVKAPLRSFMLMCWDHKAWLRSVLRSYKPTEEATRVSHKIARWKYNKHFPNNAAQSAQ